MATRFWRRIAGDPEHNNVVRFALFAPFILVLALLGYAIENERSRREIERSVLRDYSRLAVAELARLVSIVLHGDLHHPLALPMEASGARGPGQPVPPIEPARLLDPEARPRVAMMTARCLMCAEVRGTFRLDLPSGDLATAGVVSPMSPSLRTALDSLAATAGDPHRLFAVTGDGPSRILGMFVRSDSVARTTWVYGVEMPAEAIGQVVREVLENRSLLPSALVSPPYTRDQVRVAVQSPAGEQLWSNAEMRESASAVDTLPPFLGHLHVAVELGPAFAAALRIGRPSRLYLPAIFAMLALSAGLAWVALVQLRRGREIAQLRSRFVANVSHELRTPLTQISMFAEMLALERDRDAVERRKFAEIIRREVARLGTLVEGVMRFARSDEGQGRIRLERRNLAADVRDAIDFFSLVAAGRDARLKLDVQGEPIVHADPGALRQILLNLLDNAVKYGPTGQTVRTEIRVDAGRAIVEITDEGPGVPPSERRRVFEPYVRIELPLRPRTAGAGIGLSVVRDLVDAHGGTVRFVDTDIGARVRLELPVVESAGAAINAAAQYTVSHV